MATDSKPYRRPKGHGTIRPYFRVGQARYVARVYFWRRPIDAFALAETARSNFGNVWRLKRVLVGRSKISQGCASTSEASLSLTDFRPTNS